MNSKAKKHPKNKSNSKPNPAKQHSSKKKQAKPNSKGKNKSGKLHQSSPGSSAVGDHAAGEAAPEKVVHEPEPAAEDDHAFFDDDENEGYANFMMSLDESAMPTFTKRTKDRVAVAPISRKKKRDVASSGTSTAAGGSTATVTAEPVAPPPPLATEVTAVVNASVASDADVDAPKAKRRREAAVDAKRRKASTAGWVEEDVDAPARLPIKTRKGELKPNRRMMEQPAVVAMTAAAPSLGSDKAFPTVGIANGAPVTNGVAGAQDKMDVVENGQDGQPEGSDHVSDLGVSDDSVFDSADDHSSDEGGYYSNPGVSEGHAGVTVSGRGGVDLVVLKQRRFLQKKMIMAELCETIIGAPEESLVRPKVVAQGEDERSRMEQLFSLVSTPSPSVL